MSRILRFPVAVACLLAVASPSSADLISSSNLSIESNSMGAFNGSWVPQNLINESGLSPYSSSTFHSEIDFGNTWFTPNGVTTGTMVFDLGQVWNLTAFHVWNESNGPGSSGQQIPTIRLETSLLPASGYAFTSLGGGPLNILPGGTIGQSNLMPSVTLNFAPVSARYVRMTVLGSAGSNLVGLREVAFSQVPEPSALVAIATIGGVLALRRGRRAVA